MEILSKGFRAKSSGEWLAALQEADVPAALGQTALEVMEDPHCQENGLFDEREHPELGPVRQYGIGPRFSDMSGIIRRTAPLLGQHTEEVLQELGYTWEQIIDLKTKKIVFTSDESNEQSSE